MKKERETTFWLAWRLVIGRGWRRFSLIALFTVPVLLSTVAMQVIGMLNLSGPQKAQSQLGQANLSVVPAVTGKNQPDLASALPAPVAPGEMLRVQSFTSLPVVISGITRKIPYRETDWSNSMTSGLMRTVSGRLPSSADEIAVSRALASESHLSLGDTIRYPWAPESAKPARIVGTVEDPTGYQAKFAAGGPGLFAQWDDHVHTGLLGLSTSWLVKSSSATEAIITATARAQHWQVTTRSAASSSKTLLEAQPGLLAVPGLAIVLFSAAAAFSIRMRRLKRQLAMLSAIGFSGDRVVRLARSGGAVAVTIGTATGVVGGVVLGQAARPLVREAVQRDLSSFSIPLTALAILTFGAITSGVAGIWLPTRSARTSSVKERLTRAPRPGGRSRRHTIVAVAGAVGVLAVLFSATQGTGVVGPIGAMLIVLATLAAVPDVLHTLGRLSTRLPLAGRFALRDLARERRRPVAAIASSALAVVLAVSTASFVGSQTEQDRRTHVGSRHVNQVELPLRNTEPSAAILSAIRGVVGDATPVETLQAAVPAEVHPAAEGNRLSVPPVLVRIGNGQLGDVRVVDTAEQFRDLTGRAPTPREWKALTEENVLVLAPGRLNGSTEVTLSVPPADPGSAPPAPVPAAAVQADPVDQVTLAQTKALLTSAGTRAKGFSTFTVGYRATLETSATADLENRLGRAVEPLGIPTSDIHVERGYQPLLPARWSVTLAIGAAIALLSAMTAVGSSAQEIRPRMLLLRVVGFAGAIQRRILAAQAAVIVGLAMLIGILGGWLVAGSQLWPQNIEVSMPWPTIVATALGVIGLSSAFAATLRPHVDSRLRER
ncbi:hypothetical protein ACIHEI_08390 [Kitasatospora sp. NPDC051984]|uniref:hypothetical protein n=1 Tax=Kitasatospora sp. NPDC051984 TaxID=3364059 RepID=UPI0037CB7239